MRRSRALAPIAAFLGLAVVVAVLPSFVSASARSSSRTWRST